MPEQQVPITAIEQNPDSYFRKLITYFKFIIRLKTMSSRFLSLRPRSKFKHDGNFLEKTKTAMFKRSIELRILDFAV